MIWVGSVLTLGYVAAPVLFGMLDRTSAGSVAAQLFRIEGFLGVICALPLSVFKTLVAAYQSDEVRQYILSRFDGEILPVF